jgi:pantetheine-phosphate adenylyltransferase
MTRTAVYAGSFDPFTNGHLWMVQSGIALFDHLIVAVGENPGKHPTFSVAERIKMIERSIVDLSGLEVASFPFQYLVNYANERSANFILRGIRSVGDFDAEAQMVDFNRSIRPGVETVFLKPPPELARVSSSAIKVLIGPAGWEKEVGKYVPAPVLEELIKKRNA